MWIWFWNSVNSASPNRKGGCRRTCILHLASKNNIRSGRYNPCRPYEPLTEVEDEIFPPEHAQLEPSKTSLATDMGRRGLVKLGSMIPLFRSQREKTEEPGRCRNTITGGPACDREQYETGEFRLNACLQCDECKSGPKFKKIAGRTRRNSGIRSAIERPGFKPLQHNYYEDWHTEL